jgi:hypothetical protein
MGRAEERIASAREGRSESASRTREWGLYVICDRPVADHSPRTIAIFSLNAVPPIVQVEPGSVAWRAGVDIADCTRNEV